ncbi:MAG: hypothetical protein E3J35_05240 [Methanomassiliicoccales archaeon]|nr:MAG: hypothetical protein E3J35_05240 [Methanomassiliicoccales archaeon]
MLQKENLYLREDIDDIMYLDTPERAKLLVALLRLRIGVETLGEYRKRETSFKDIPAPARETIMKGITGGLQVITDLRKKIEKHLSGKQNPYETVFLRSTLIAFNFDWARKAHDVLFKPVHTDRDVACLRLADRHLKSLRASLIELKKGRKIDEEEYTFDRISSGTNVFLRNVYENWLEEVNLIEEEAETGGEWLRVH